MGQIANAITVLTSFLLGRYIVEQEQQGAERGFSRSNIAGMRQFYMAYKDGENEIIQSGIGQLNLV